MNDCLRYFWTDVYDLMVKYANSTISHAIPIKVFRNRLRRILAPVVKKNKVMSRR